MAARNRQFSVSRPTVIAPVRHFNARGTVDAPIFTEDPGFREYLEQRQQQRRHAPSRGYCSAQARQSPRSRVHVAVRRRRLRSNGLKTSSARSSTAKRRRTASGPASRRTPSSGAGTCGSDNSSCRTISCSTTSRARKRSTSWATGGPRPSECSS